ARAESGSLHAADLSVIFMEDEDPEIEEVLNRKVVRDAEGHITSDTEDPVLEEEFKDFLIEARDRIGEVLEELAGEVVFEADPQSLSLEDRFASWNRQLSQALGTGAILEKLEAIDGEDPEGLYQNLIERSLHKKEVTIKELIDASINHHREAIFDTIRGSLPADEADQELFIGQHGRFHQNLKDSDTYSKLKSKRTELSERQTQVYRDAQEAQHKVYELFPNTEWNRIWTIAEALIDEDGWQEIADQMLLDDEDLDREIKKEEAIKEAFLAFGRKHRWHINPVNMDVFWKPLVKAGIPHNFYTNLLDASSLVLNDTLARDEVSEAIEYNHERLSGGENTDFPGEKLLNEVEIQVMPYRMDIQRQCEEYTKHFMQLQDSFDHNPQALQSTLNLIHELRVELVPYLRTQKEEIQAMLEQLAPDKAVFIKAYLESIEAQISGLETSAQKHWEGLQDTERNEARGYKFSKDDELFTHFPGMFGGIDKSFSFIDGDRGDFMDKHFEEFKDSQKKVPESVAFIKDKLGLFEVGGRDKAREKYEQIQQKYGHTFHKFDENYEVYTKRMNTDMKLLTDAEFTQRHGESKAQVGQNIMMLNEHHKGFQQIWGKYEDPDFFQNWIKQYENPESRSSAISEFDFWDTISQQENTMENLNHGFGAWITAHNKSWVEETGPVSLEQLWHKTKKGAGKFLLDDVQWYSINGIMGMFQDVMEITKRLSERRTEKEKALLGKVIFGESGVWGLGHEFTRKSTESEEARVDEYKNRYKRKDPWSIKKELYAVRGPGEADKARALIDLLVEKGQIRWNDPELWYVLNRLNAFNSGAPQFSPADIEKDQGEIRDKVRYACEAIWDDYVFAAWDGSLPGNYKNAKEASFNKFDNMESYGDREAIWADMLDKWKRGVPDETVDPAEYEGFLFRAFQNGKVNGQPDRRWFYLIMGTTVKNPRGETLVSREIFDRLDGELLSTVPYFDFFTDKSSPKKDGRIVPEGTPGAHPTWTFEDMEAWGDFFGGSEGKFGFHAGKDNKVLQAKCHEFFYNFICSSDNAMMRVDRMNRGASKNADHDDAQMWFAGMSFQGMAQMLNRASEGTDLVTPDFAGTLLQGFDLFMKASYEYIMRGDAEYGIDNVGWQKMREKRLMQTGQRMRVAFGALHTVSGNYKGNAQQTPLTLDQSFWNQNKYDVKGSRDKISEAIQDLLKENGKDLAEYDGIWDFVGTKEISENGVDRSNNKEWQKVNKKISNIVGSADEDLGVSHFEELGSVEKVLKKYAMNHGGIYDTGAKNENPKFLY
ncbi:MAG TPA: hypothetical protein VIT68_03500, partial [Candidatus Gracilibacteria bacterium]